MVGFMVRTEAVFRMSEEGGMAPTMGLIGGAVKDAGAAGRVAANRHG